MTQTLPGIHTTAASASGSFDVVANSYYKVALGRFFSLGGSPNQAVQKATWAWGFGSLPGTTPGNPLPPVGRIGETYDFAVAVIGETSDMTYIDPAIAVGYDYASTDRKFRSVLIPAALPNGDANFELIFEGNTVALAAGTAFDFTTVVPDGVSSFSIRGIDTGEGLDPNDPGAFVTGLTFLGEGATDVYMTPVAPVPEPGLLLLVVAAGWAGIQVRRRVGRVFGATAGEMAY